MKDMTTVLNKKIVNKETNEVRLVVKIDEENRKIFSVPASEPTAEPTGMAAASYPHRAPAFRSAYSLAETAQGLHQRDSQ